MSYGRMKLLWGARELSHPYPLKDVSIVTLIHNEAEILPYTLPLILHLEADETLLIFDRCKDHSLEIAEKIVDGKPSRLIGGVEFISLDEAAGVGWYDRLAYLHHFGYQYATEDYVLDIDADMLVDAHGIAQGIKRLKYSDDVKLVIYGFMDQPPTPQMYLRRAYSRLPIFKARGQLQALNREAYLELNTLQRHHDHPVSRYQDALVQRDLETYHNSTHINTETMHLRPTEGIEYNHKRAIGHAQLGSTPPFVIIQSLAMLRIGMIPPYLKALRMKRR